MDEHSEFKYKLRDELKNMQNGFWFTYWWKWNPKRYVKWDVYSFWSIYNRYLV